MSDINNIVLVCKTHLDIGFTDIPSRVVSTYLDHFIPNAIALGRAQAEADEGQPGFVWTTGSWLIWQALEQADPGRRAEVEMAIASGWLRWHALPATFHSELLNATLLEAGLAMSQTLDRRFGVTTRTAKMTDVPGHTLGLVPHLAAAGVTFLHLGVNPASRVPNVPPIFRWQHPDGSEITVAYDAGYGRSLTIPGSSTALAFLFTNDNLGPPRAAAIEAERTALAAAHPGARVQAGTLDDAIADLDPSSLPVVTSEIGDSWMHGVGSAPQRIGDYLAIRRALTNAPASPGRDAACRSAMLVAEHTWGLDSKPWLPNHRPLDPGTFAHERRRAAWRPLEQAYAEQDAYLADAQTQADATLAQAMARELADSQAVRCLPQASTDTEHDRNQPVTTARWVVRVDPCNGVLSQLIDRHTGQDWCAGPANGRLGMLRYQVLGEQRFRRWVESYLLPDEELWWAAEDFDGPVQHDRFASDLVIPYRLEHMWVDDQTDHTRLTMHCAARHQRLNETGAPPSIGLQWLLPNDPQAAIELTVGWDHKPAALARESLWLGWRPGTRTQRVIGHKLGSRIDLDQVVADGGLLHAVDQVELHGDISLALTPLDSPLCCADGPRILERHQGSRDPDRGLWCNLLNTAWSTNFGFWTEGPMGFRYRLEAVNKHP